MTTRLVVVVNVETLGVLIPGPAAAGVECLPANNNLDLIRFADRLWLVWRTAPNHFASADARLEITSAPDVAGPWRHEQTIHVGADLREPRWLVDGDRLHLWFMRLGSDPKRFQPSGVFQTTTDGVVAPGATSTSWSNLELVVGPDSVPWRVRRLRGRWAMLGYRGAERMYSPRPVDPSVEVRWSNDLTNWSDPVEIHHGGTECELVELPDGRIVGVTRNEGPSRRGGDLLVGADPEALAVTPIRRKPDSPNLVLWGGEPYLFARRQVAHDGAYDRCPSWVPGPLAIRLDQAVWSLTRKRSALYRIDPDGPSLEWVLDLPSRGDCAFTAVVEEPDGSLLVADYSSPAGAGDVAWIRGQLRPTGISLHRLTLDADRP